MKLFKFQEDEKYYLFNSYIMKSLEVDKKTYYNNELSQIYININDEKMQIKDIIKNRNKNGTLDISIPISHGCNLACKYCFADDTAEREVSKKPISKELLRKGIDMATKLYPDYNAIHVSLVSGAEPTLNISFIQDIIEILNQRNVKSSLFIATNGTNDFDLFNQIKNLRNISIGISVDGEQKEHDLCRVFHDGSGSYNKIIKNIEINKNNKNDSIKKLVLTAWGLAVIHPANDNPLKIFNKLHEIGFKKIQMKIMSHSMLKNNKNYLIKLISNYRKLGNRLFELYLADEFNKFISLINDVDYLGRIIQRLILKYPVFTSCGIGYTKFALSSDGYLYPCQRFEGIKKFRLANSINGEIYDYHNEIKNINVLSRRKCKNCEIRYLCGGDCLYNSYISSDNLLEIDPQSCYIQKELCKIAILLIHNMKEKCEDKFEKIKRLLEYSTGVKGE